MDPELELLRQAASRILARDPELAREIWGKHAPTAEFVARERPGFEAMEGPADPVAMKMTLETIVKRTGRPVLTVRNNDFIFAAPDMESEVWRRRLDDARARLRQIIPSVGRIEVENNPGFTWLGTGWLVADDIVLTNRHVAQEFAYRSGDRFVFRRAVGFSQAMTSRIDFLREDGNPAQLPFRVVDVLYIEDDEDGPDLAFLRTERTSGASRLAPRVPLAAGAPRVDQFIAAVGYPARDSRVPDQALVTRLFGEIYDKKRLAPGALIRVADDHLSHDCSTLGGNSGSVLVDLNTGEAVGLHFAGLYLQENLAVPAATVRDRLERVQGGKIVPVSSPSPRPGEGKQMPKPDPSSPPSSDGESLIVTIPLTVTVQIALPVQVTTGVIRIKPDSGRVGKSEMAAAVEEARRRLKGKDGVVDVRAGYRFRNGWITKEPALVALVRRKLKTEELAAAGVAPLPREINGVPLDVTPVSAWDLLEQVPQAESLEGIPATHYRPPVDFHLEPVEEEMNVICHVSPDAGWPQLRAFLEATKHRLTVGMYDFTAPHIVEGVKAAVRPGSRRFNLVIQHGSAIEGEVKADDIPDEKVVAQFARLLKGRFKQAWASVTGPNRLFASAYHIKVAVRDGTAFWLSSGNWQSSNQPDADPLDGDDASAELLRKHNREWHAIVTNTALAGQFERFLLYDLEQAEAVEEEAVAAMPMILLPEAYLTAEVAVTEAVPRFFRPLIVNRRVRVQPLLTPDNFQEQVLTLVQGARERICFQNQSLNLLAEGKNDERFEELVAALRDKQRAGLDVRLIIRGDFNPRPVLEKLQDFGFDMDRVKVQNGCHTKGIVIDSDRVVLGSHNWTNQGTLVNRDASLIFFDPEIARYYEQIFEYDWTNRARKKVIEELPAVELAGTRETPAGMTAVSLAEILG
jgi:V8-like Glu-specific endopeptidase